MLSAASDVPEVEPLTLTGQGEFAIHSTAIFQSLTKPQIVDFESGGFAVTWNGESLRRFDESGAPIGPAINLQDADGDIAVNASGNSVAVMTTGAVVAVARHDSNGARIGDYVIVSLTATSQTVPQVEMDAAGRFVVVWKGSNSNANAIYARWYDATGTPLGDQQLIGETTASFEAAMNESGDLVIGYGTSVVKVAVSRPGGQTLGSITVPSATDFASIAINDTGDFAVRYGTSGRFVRRFDAATQALGSAFDIGLALTAVDMALESGGGLIVTGHRSGTGYEVGGSGNAVLARRFDPTGAAQGNWFLVNSTVAGNQQYPTVAVINGSEFIVTWENPGQLATDNNVINAQRFVDDELPVVEAVTPAWGTRIISGATLLPQLPSVRVVFSRPMESPDVTSPANWQLLDDGIDVSSLIAGIAYENDAAVLTFTQPLRGDGYQLIASDAIHDVLGRALDGDSSGAAGGTFSISFSIQQGVFGLGPEAVLGDVGGLYDLKQPSVAVNEHGGFAIGYYGGTWQEAPRSYARVFDANGIPFTSSFFIGSPRALNNLKSLSGDNYLALSTYPYVNSLHWLGATAVAQSSAFDIGFNEASRFASNDSGTVVVWNDFVSINDYDVYAQRLDTQGQLIGSPFLVNSTTVDRQTGSSIAMAASGDFVIVWSSNGQDGSGYGTFARRFAADGTPLSGEFQVNTFTTGNQYYSSIAMTPNGDFVITWISEGQDGSDGVYMQRYSAGGSPLGGETRLNAIGTVAAGPSLVMDGSGRMLAVWTQGGNTLVARAMSNNGSAIGSPIQVNTSSVLAPSIDFSNWQARLAINAFGDAVVAWVSRVGSSNTTDTIRFQRLSLGHPPIVDLNGLTDCVDFESEAQLDGNPVAIVDTDLFVSDAPVENLVGGTITVVGALAGDLLSVDTAGTSIVAAYADGVLTLSGTDTVEHYQQVLRTATFASTAARVGSSTVEVQFVVDDGLATSPVATAQVAIYVPGSASVAGRYLFYNNSSFDQSAGNDAAIALDKSAYLAGSGPATFANVSSYSRGINGVLFNLAGDHGTPTFADLSFKIGASNDHEGWTDAPLPISLTVRAGAGTGGADRLEIAWADGAIRNTWLQVTVAANIRTGLAEPDVFYFGNKIGDSGINPGSSTFDTTSTDAAGVFAAIGPGKPVTYPRDYNRDGQVTSTDAAIVFANIGRLAQLDLPGQALVASPQLTESTSIAVPSGLLASRDTAQAVASALTSKPTDDATPARRTAILAPRVLADLRTPDPRATWAALAAIETWKPIGEHQLDPADDSDDDWLAWCGRR